MESFTRIEGLSLSARMIAPVATRIYAQWPELAERAPRLRFAGNLFLDSMILVTTGTNEQPFDRLVRAAAELAEGEDAFVQYGASREPHGAGEWVDFLAFDELAERMREARVVVCHAGVGSIMLARRCGHRPVVMPRRLELGEAVDDHQLQLARRLHQAGLVTLVEDERELADRDRRGRGDVASAASDLKGSAALTTELRTFFGTLVRPTMALATTAGTPAKEV